MSLTPELDEQIEAVQLELAMLQNKLEWCGLGESEKLKINTLAAEARRQLNRLRSSRYTLKQKLSYAQNPNVDV